MTHRDELLALQARIEAMERDFDEARSENELLRAAHAQKTREAENLKRQLASVHDPLEPPAGPAPPELRRQAPSLQIRRAMQLAAISLGIMMLGTATMSSMMAAQARSHRARMHYASARSGVTPLVRAGTVTEMTGPAILEVGDRCSVQRIPVAAAGPFDCRVVVRCGEHTLYGADPRTGFVRCAGQEIVRDSNTTAFDGDPAMTLDLARDVVTVEERVGLATQRVRIQL